MEDKDIEIKMPEGDNVPLDAQNSHYWDDVAPKKKRNQQVDEPEDDDEDYYFPNEEA